MTNTSMKITEIVKACQSYGQRDIIVLSGVPATGKTYLSELAAETVTGHPGLVRRTQFHPGYSYEDFLEGLRPRTAGGYEVVDGIFLEWNRLAAGDGENTYVLLIEEFSRADIPAVLGELMTFIEHRNDAFVLPISQSAVSVAQSLVILATMNPRDRSALEIDEAMLRRLRIIECPPDIEQLNEMLSSSLTTPPAETSEVIEQASQIFIKCESEFPDSYLSEMPFGHGIFSGVANINQLTDLWHQKIRHILYRPQGLIHPFAEVIRENYPWK